VAQDNVRRLANPSIAYTGVVSIQEEMRAKSAAMHRTEPHPSYNVVVSAALHATNGIPRKPMELVELAEAAAAQVL
jgi:hypothetical protein